MATTLIFNRVFKDTTNFYQSIKSNFMRKFFTAVLVLVSLNVSALECKGVKKDGTKCKSTIVAKATGFCHSHDPKALKCPHVKPNGDKCNMSTKSGAKCRFHASK